MQDVADLAGVSLKSVSRVVNREAHVSPKLRDKVERIIEQIGYVPDLAARSLAGTRSFTISVLFEDWTPDHPMNHHYTMNVQAGIYRACVEQSHHLRLDRIGSIDASANIEERLGAILRNVRIDGFVLTPPLSDCPLLMKMLDDAGIPYSRIAPFNAMEHAMGTRIDDHAAAASVAEYLWNLGHRRFGLVNGQKSHASAVARREGFIGRLTALDPAVTVTEAYGGFEFIKGIEAGRKLLASEPRPTAIFAANDDSAAGVMVAVREAGLDMPGDISLVGFDDSWIATTVWPLLTTVRQPIEEMSYRAACQLIARTRGDGKEGVETLEFALIERASAGAVR